MDSRHRTFALLLGSLVVVIDQLANQWAVRVLRHIGGHLPLPGPVDRNLLDIVNRRLKRGLSFSEEGAQDLIAQVDLPPNA